VPLNIVALFQKTCIDTNVVKNTIMAETIFVSY